MARKFSRFIKKQKICPSHPFVFRPRTVQVISILIMSKLMFIGQLFLELSCWSDCWAKTTKTPLQAKKYGSCKEEFYDNFELNFEFKPFELQTLSPWTWKFPKSRNRFSPVYEDFSNSPMRSDCEDSSRTFPEFFDPKWFTSRSVASERLRIAFLSQCPLGLLFEWIWIFGIPTKISLERVLSNFSDMESKLWKKINN